MGNRQTDQKSEKKYAGDAAVQSLPLLFPRLRKRKALVQRERKYRKKKRGGGELVK